MLAHGDRRSNVRQRFREILLSKRPMAGGRVLRPARTSVESRADGTQRAQTSGAAAPKRTNPGGTAQGAPRRSTTPRTGRHILALSASVVKGSELETPRPTGSGSVTWRTQTPQLTNRSDCVLSMDKRSQVSVCRPTTPKKDRVTTEREEAAALRLQEETLQKKAARRKNSMRAVLRSADGLYPRRSVNLLPSWRCCAPDTPMLQPSFRMYQNL